MLRSISVSSLDTLLGGMRAILATISSMSGTSMVDLRMSGVRSIWAAPTSSITSIDLSGSLRSWM